MTRLTLIVLGLLLSGCASYPDSDGRENGSQRNSGWQTGQYVTAKLDLNLCNTRVSNPPNSIAGRVLRETSQACVNKRLLLVAPAVEACVTSGYGRRFGKQHHGVDFQAKPANLIVAAAAGTIVQKSYRAKDLGNWIVIDHGRGVYSAYGHLSSFERGVSVGKKVGQGQPLGVMGATGKAARGVHLHYEVRVGRLSRATSFFSLQSLDPFALPTDCG